MELLTKERLKKELIFLFAIAVVFWLVAGGFMVYYENYQEWDDYLLAMPVIMLIAYIVRVIVLIMRSIKR